MGRESGWALWKLLSLVYAGRYRIGRRGDCRRRGAIREHAAGGSANDQRTGWRLVRKWTARVGCVYRRAEEWRRLLVQRGAQHRKRSREQSSERRRETGRGVVARFHAGTYPLVLIEKQLPQGGFGSDSCGTSGARSAYCPCVQTGYQRHRIAISARWRNWGISNYDPGRENRTVAGYCATLGILAAHATRKYARMQGRENQQLWHDRNRNSNSRAPRVAASTTWNGRSWQSTMNFNSWTHNERVSWTLAVF